MMDNFDPFSGWDPWGEPDQEQEQQSEDIHHSFEIPQSPSLEMEQHGNQVVSLSDSVMRVRESGEPVQELEPEGDFRSEATETEQPDRNLEAAEDPFLGFMRGPGFGELGGVTPESVDVKSGSGTAEDGENDLPKRSKPLPQEPSWFRSYGYTPKTENPLAEFEKKSFGTRPYDPSPRSFSTGRAMGGRRPPPRPRGMSTSFARLRLGPNRKYREASMAHRGEAGLEGKEYCPRCGCFVPAENIVNNPLDNPYWDRVCTSCARELTNHMRKCPRCESWSLDEQWKRCDRCGRECCSACDDLRPVSQTSGYWSQESYSFLCPDCYTDKEEEHERRRQEEFGKGNH